MPYLNLPDFEARQILTAAQLNQIIAALQGFAAQPADISWPLICGGNIDFGKQHGIVGLRTLWNIINADEYTTLQLAVDAAEAAGGGCVLIPPDTTIEADGVNIEASKIWIVGCGPSSVIQSTGSSGYSIRTGNAGLTDIGLANLTMDGNSVAGQDGIQFRYVDGLTVSGVHFKAWDGSALVITNAGTPGTQKCQHALVTDCRFDDGAAAHIDCIDLDIGLFQNITSDSATAAAALDFEPATSAGFLKNLRLTNIVVDGTTGIGVSILGASGTPNDNWSLIDLSGVQVTGVSSDAFNIGLASKILKYVSMTNCSAPAAGADAAKINVSESQVHNNFFRDATGDGIDLLASETTSVFGNHVAGAGTNAINGGTGQGNYIGQNPGYIAKIVSGVEADSTVYSKSDSTGDMGWSYTILADTIKVGDTLEVNMFADLGWGSGNMELQLQIGGVAAGNTGTVSGSDFTFWGTWKFIVTAVTGAGTEGTAVILAKSAGGTTSSTLAQAQYTIDWTSDNALTFEATSLAAGSTIQIKRLFVKLHGGP